MTENKKPDKMPKTGEKIQSKMRIGDLMVQEGILNPQNLKMALYAQKSSGLRLGEQLLRMKLISEEILLKSLCNQKGVPIMELFGVEIAPEAYRLLTETYMDEKQVLPIDFEDGELIIVHSDPLNLESLADEVSRSTGYKVRARVATKSSILLARSQYCERMSVFESVLEKMKTESPDQEVVKVESSYDLEESSSFVITFVNLIITTGIRHRATDIYVRAVENRIQIRFRIDGVLQNFFKYPPEFNQHKEKIVSRLKTIAKMDIAEKRLPQDGKFRVRLKEDFFDCRLSVIPTIYGENAVIRMLYKDMLNVTLENTGLSNYSFSLIQTLLKRPHGLMLVTGPTGSGKTTTLYASMASLWDPSKSLMTVEDPVEYEVSDYIQSQVRPEIGLNFAAMLRSILRQTPDIIMVGEIRDRETATVACEAAMTGHFVLSTLHTNNATSSVLRLTEMGVDRFLVSAVLVGVVAQRLVRRLCIKCRVPDAMDQEMEEFVARYKLRNEFVHRAGGCKICLGSGYLGRLGLHEVLHRTAKIAEIINSGGTSGDIFTEARSTGFVTLYEDGLLKVFQGLTDATQVQRVTA
jgi:type IV pilus assembly protein PilB